MVKVIKNMKVRLPTVNIDVPANNYPNISPLSQSSASQTSDGYNIDLSPYLLTFTISADNGYFDQSCITFKYSDGSDASDIFLFCNATKYKSGSGQNNYAMYFVLNGVSANNQTARETITYTVNYLSPIPPGDDSQAMPAAAQVRMLGDGDGGDIENEPSN